MNTRQSSSELQAPPEPLQMQLPYWANAQRGLPNVFARSALWNVGNHAAPRQYLKDVTIAALDNIMITYRGEELRQDDEDVFMQILHLARGQPVGTEVVFTAGAMMRELEWSRNARSTDRLINTINRLKASAITVRLADDSKGFSGSLIRKFSWQNEGGTSLRRWTVTLEPEIVQLFAPHAYSRVDWKIRLQLTPLAKWLHTFYHSHRNPYPYKVATLKTLSGSNIKHLYQFRYKLREALQLLVERNFLERASICPRTDLVTVERKPTPLALEA